jgi:hypothetical protein
MQVNSTSALARAVLLVAASLSLAGLPSDVGASCNVIPGAQLDFVGEAGSLNRPFAAPGDFVKVRPSGCTGATFSQADEVRVVFRPPTNPVSPPDTGDPTVVPVLGASVAIDGA